MSNDKLTELAIVTLTEHLYYCWVMIKPEEK
jgi:hypothetical protein